MNFLPRQYRSIAYYPVMLAFLLLISGCQQSPKAIGTAEGGKVADGNIALPADRTIASPSYLTASQDNLPKGVNAPDSLSQDRFLMENGEQPIQFLEVDENSNPDKKSLKYTLKYQSNPNTAIPILLHYSTNLLMLREDPLITNLENNLAIGM